MYLLFRYAIGPAIWAALTLTAAYFLGIEITMSLVILLVITSAISDILYGIELFLDAHR